MELFKKVCEGKAFEHIEVVFVSKDGKEIYVEGNVNPWFKDGKFIATRGIFRDITERKRAEEKLRESRRHFQRLFNSMVDPVVIVDSKGKFLEINDKVEKVTGYKREELLGKNFLRTEIVTGKSKRILLKSLVKRMMGVKLAPYEIEVLTKDGKKLPFEINATKIEYNGKAADMVAFRDITERKKTEEKLNEAHERLRTFNKELEEKVKERTAEVENLLEQKNEFIGQLSHDLRSPLTPLTALLPMIEEKEQDSYLKEELEVVIHNIKYLNKLVDKTIKLAQLNSPNTIFSLDTATLLDELNTIIEKNKLVFEENGLEIMNRVDERITVKADKPMLGELFNNLFTNAVKYSPQGGTITIDAKDDGDWVTVSIKDTGIGLTKEEIDHIFEEFYKADWSRHDHMSSGLGLSICKTIIKKHGGKIWAESPGKRKGTTVFFTIPSSLKEGMMNRGR